MWVIWKHATAIHTHIYIYISQKRSSVYQHLFISNVLFYHHYHSSSYSSLKIYIFANTSAAVQLNQKTNIFSEYIFNVSEPSRPPPAQQSKNHFQGVRIMPQRKETLPNITQTTLGIWTNQDYVYLSALGTRTWNMGSPISYSYLCLSLPIYISLLHSFVNAVQLHRFKFWYYLRRRLFIKQHTSPTKTRKKTKPTVKIFYVQQIKM